jgi:alpha,alpha-trehalase
MPEQKVFFIEVLESLYKEVQLQKVFPDSKYFVDCTPNGDPVSILHTYEKEKGKAGFDLKKFVTTHFIFPADIVSMYKSGNKPIVQHLEELWNELTRQPEAVRGNTLIPLSYPYIVPGGRFREIYYWDTYFTMLGLQVCKRVDLMQNMVDNFAYLLDSFGFIPNANRTYYLSRSQPPFFTLMVGLLAEEKGESILLKYHPQIEKEYTFWMDGEKNLTASQNNYRRTVLLPGGSILNRYWDDKNTPRPEAYTEDIHLAITAGGEAAHVYQHLRAACESGWDFSGRWCKDSQNMFTIQTTHLIPVDLNCLLLHTEEVLLKIYTLTNKHDLAESFTQKISSRKKAIQQYCWNESHGFYFDYHFIEQTQTNQCTLAAVYPLFFSVATNEQAGKVAQLIEEKFLQQGGVVTTLSDTGQQWDGPNGWAPLQWMAYKGLKNYGYHKLAGEIKNRWMATNEKVYAATGKMMEKYDVADAASEAGGGEYPNQDGFGWTNGVYLKFSREP